MVDALLFDLGGVVIDIDFGRALQAWADAARVPVPQIAERFCFDAPYEAHERGEIGPDEYCAHLRAALGLPLADDELLAGWNRIFVGPVPGMQGLLERLRHRYPLYAFSNTNHAHLGYWQPRYASLLSPFSAVYCSCEIGARKPEVEAFLEVARRMGVSPGRIAFFDDHSANVLGARKAGLLAHEAHSVAQVREALSQWGIRLGEAG